MLKSSQHKDYFEAILQLRPRDEELEEYVLRRIKSRLDVKISKKIEKKFGIDLYLNSKKFARDIAGKLRKAFDGELKMSSQVHKTDRWTSKVLTRLTICFRRKG